MIANTVTKKWHQFLLTKVINRQFHSSNDSCSLRSWPNALKFKKYIKSYFLVEFVIDEFS